MPYANPIVAKAKAKERYQKYKDKYWKNPDGSWKKRAPEARRKTANAWYQRNKLEVQRKMKEKRDRTRHIGDCAICGWHGHLHWDHDHSTGLFRGWLCPSCNLALGHARENPNTLQKMIMYLVASKKMKEN